MKFEYTGRHVEVTEAIRRHVEEHFSKIDHLFADSTTRAHVRIEVEKNRHIGEIVVHWHDHTLTATDTNHDMYQALTRAIAKLEKQAVKLKKKIIDRSHHAQPTAAAAIAIAVDAPLEIAENADGAADEKSAAREPRIIPVESYGVKPMTAEEAAMQLSSDSNQFLIFRDSETDRMNVLYKRSDGNFGLIEPV